MESYELFVYDANFCIRDSMGSERSIRARVRTNANNTKHHPTKIKKNVVL